MNADIARRRLDSYNAELIYIADLGVDRGTPEGRRRLNRRSQIYANRKRCWQAIKRAIPMDELGRRIMKDTALIEEKRRQASNLQKQARQLRREADELERLMELARLERNDEVVG